MRKEIGRYRCRGADGREYTVIEYQNFQRFEPMSGPAQDVPTTKECFLDDGRDVNWIYGDTFKIVITDEVIRRVP
jgi:hypothetical protein